MENNGLLLGNSAEDMGVRLGQAMGFFVYPLMQPGPNIKWDKVLTQVRVLKITRTKPVPAYEVPYNVKRYKSRGFFQQNVHNG